jgi:ATP-binding cassette, subfamily B, bacterial MsbA
MNNAIFARLLSELKLYRTQVIVVALTGLVYSAAYSRLGFIIKGILDGFEQGNAHKISNAAYMGLALAFIIAASRYFHIFKMNMIAESVVNSLRMRMQNKFMHLSLSFHSQFEAGAGGMMSRILNDMKVIQDGLRMVADFFREPLLAILLLANLFYLNWQLTLTILIVLPLMLYFLRQISRGLRKYVLLGQENLERMTATIKESLDGVRTIQSYNLEKMMSQKMSQQSDDYLQLRKKIHSRIEIMGPVTEFIATCMVIAIFFYFSSELAKGRFTSGDVIAYVGMMLMINGPLKKLQESYVRIQETFIAAQRIYQVLDEARIVEQSPNAVAFPANWKTIEYRNVSFNYGDKLSLSNLNLVIRRGSRVAFVGESGSGKSTLVNLLPRFYDPTEGEIFIDNIPLKNFDLTDLRKNIALVSQDTFLFAESLEKNIAAAEIFDAKKVQDCARLAYAYDFIASKPHGFLTHAGDRGSSLSGGEKQRVSIARALYKNAPLLVLDEATSALDSTSELEVQKGLDQLLQDRTALIIAHRLSTVQSADVIYVMASGRVVCSGSHDGLLKNSPEYKRYWDLQKQS